MFGIVTKQMFFDRKKVLGAVDRATRRVLGRFGAYVRLTARHSIHKRKGPSSPGHPPHSHTGHLRGPQPGGIVYGYDTGRKSVVIGPTRLNIRFFDRNGQPLAAGTVPEVLEYGGEIHILEVFAGRYGWQRVDLRRSRRSYADKRLRLRRVKIGPRPFMGPAFAKEKPRLRELWANSVR